MKRKKFILLFLVLVVLTGGIVYWRLTAQPPSQNDEPSNGLSSTNVAKPDTEEQKTRRQLLGIWQDEYKGKRTMTLNEDGTGTMLVELSGAQAFLFASKLRFDMKWTLDGMMLTKKTISGEPADKVNLILNTMGNTAEETIVEVTEDRLLLLDKDGKTNYDWRRPKKDETSK